MFDINQPLLHVVEVCLGEAGPAVADEVDGFADLGVGIKLKQLPNTKARAKRRSPGLVNCFSCLPILPGFACGIHATWGPPFSRALYILTN